MEMSLYERWIQVEVEKNSYFEKKAREFVDKHFTSVFNLSNSMLIFTGEGEKYRRDYFLNWAYHISANRDIKKISAQKILSLIDMPIRLKVRDDRAVVDYVTVFTSFITAQKVSMVLSKQNRLAKRYLISKFRDNIISYDKTRLFLDSSAPGFWESMIESMQTKTIFNVCLNFEHEKFEYEKFSNAPSYLTKQERALRESYDTLKVSYDTNFEDVRERFLSLAKEYHPDNVYGLDSSIVDIYTKKFRKIQEAYDFIKNSRYCAA